MLTLGIKRMRLRKIIMTTTWFSTISTMCSFDDRNSWKNLVYAGFRSQRKSQAMVLTSAASAIAPGNCVSAWTLNYGHAPMKTDSIIQVNLCKLLHFLSILLWKQEPCRKVQLSLPLFMKLKIILYRVVHDMLAYISPNKMYDLTYTLYQPPLTLLHSQWP